jgi:hypothetical protein
MQSLVVFSSPIPIGCHEPDYYAEEQLIISDTVFNGCDVPFMTHGAGLTVAHVKSKLEMQRCVLRHCRTTGQGAAIYCLGESVFIMDVVANECSANDWYIFRFYWSGVSAILHLNASSFVKSVCSGDPLCVDVRESHNVVLVRSMNGSDGEERCWSHRLMFLGAFLKEIEKLVFSF